MMLSLRDKCALGDGQGAHPEALRDASQDSFLSWTPSLSILVLSVMQPPGWVH